MCGKKDLEIRTGESNIKSKRITELKIANEMVFIEIVIRQWEMMVWTWKLILFKSDSIFYTTYIKGIRISCQ